MTQRAVYRQIMHDLKASIAGGLHPVGDMLPSSNQLAADYRTTRATVTKALLLLVQAGWIEPRQGVGYFVLSVRPESPRDTTESPTPGGLPMHRLVSVEEVSAYLGVPATTLYQWRHKGLGPASMRIGRYVRYRPRDVLDWCEAQRR